MLRCRCLSPWTFHAHAQSPKATELIATAPANPGGEANEHNQYLGRTRYDAAFRDISVRLHTMDRERIDNAGREPRAKLRVLG